MSLTCCRAQPPLRRRSTIRGRRQFQPARRHDPSAAPRGVAINSRPYFRASSRPNPLNGVRCQRNSFSPGRRLFRRTGHLTTTDRPQDTSVGPPPALACLLTSSDPEGRILLVLRRARHAARMPLLRSSAPLPTSRTTWLSGRKENLRGAGARPATEVVKFDKNGNSSGVGQERHRSGRVDIAIRIAIDAQGLLYVGGSQTIKRIQVFDADGSICGNPSILDPPCGLFIVRIRTSGLLHRNTPDGLIKLDLDATCLGSPNPGPGPGPVREAHFLAVSTPRRLLCRRTLNLRVQSFVEIPVIVCDRRSRFRRRMNVQSSAEPPSSWKSATRLSRIALPGGPKPAQSGPSASSSHGPPAQRRARQSFAARLRTLLALSEEAAAAGADTLHLLHRGPGLAVGDPTSAAARADLDASPTLCSTG